MTFHKKFTGLTDFADADIGTVFYPDNESNIASKCSVEIARIFNGQVAILGGLEEVKEVITEGSAYLREGSQIEIQTEDQTNKTASK